LSYRNVITVYTKVGGAYIVSRENFGPVVAQIAAVALMLDYIVTLAIQSAAGVAAIISTFPALSPWKIHMTLAIILFLTYGNLRGVKEAGKAFALPTYLFVGSMLVVFSIGIFRQLAGTLPVLDVNQPGVVEIGQEQGLLTAAAIFILLRAFANGGSSLTGLEAISDGVALFNEPEYKNARKTLVLMSLILGSLVLGVSYFAHKIYAMPYESGTPTVISQIAKSILGDGAFGSAFFILVQAATMLILFAGANTTYSAFPMVVNFVAQDGYLPNWLTKRGHRLNFSNGIFVLTAAAMILVLVTGASVEHLVAYYALGVFTAFTLSGLGMAKHAKTHKQGSWRVKFAINGLSGSISLLVVLIFAVVKFNQGAWVVVVITPFLVMVFLRLRKQYVKEKAALDITVQSSRATSITRHDVSVLIDNFDLATIGAIRYARSLKPRNLTALHFVLDDKKAENLSREWAKNEACSDIPLELVDCPDRRLANAAVDYAVKMTADSSVELTLLLPRRSYSKLLGWLLHDQTAEDIARPISQLERVVATIVPFDVEKIISGQNPNQNTIHESKIISSEQAQGMQPVRAQSSFTDSLITKGNNQPVSHYAKDLLPIGSITWRSRANVQGVVNSIKAAPSGAAPLVEVEIWDQTGGVTLQFLGRREIAGLEVGSQIQAEGMVGENNGQLTILNPSYKIIF
jgi:amino acid transporter